jgi:type IX secretion system PorP/SprF family membrane protein
MKKAISLFFALLLNPSFAQDVAFLNPNQSIILLNPSFAGSNGGFRNQLSYRNRWPALSGNYITYANSADVYIKRARSGIAVTYQVDDEMRGTLKTSMLSLAYARHFEFREGDLKIIPSVQGSYGQLSLDRSKLHFGDPIHPRYGMFWTSAAVLPSANTQFLDLNTAALVSYKNKLYAGAGVKHLTEPDIGLIGPSPLPRRYFLHASYNTTFAEKFPVQLFYHAEAQNQYFNHQLMVNTALFRQILIGAGYQSSSTLQCSLGYRREYFSILLGYDVDVSRLAGNTAPSWELHAAFSLRKSEVRKTFTSFESL